MNKYKEFSIACCILGIRQTLFPLLLLSAAMETSRVSLKHTPRTQEHLLIPAMLLKSPQLQKWWDHLQGPITAKSVIHKSFPFSSFILNEF